MIYVLTTLHILVCLFLIGVVLLQSGKGAEMGASFGSSGSQSVFGAGGGTTFLSKMTTAGAIIFMLTSLTLAYLSGQPTSSSIMSGKGKAPATQQTVPTQKQAVPNTSVPVQGKSPDALQIVPIQPDTPAPKPQKK